MIFLMVMLGGITRLTGSGLSMVEWQPLMGTLPPLSQSDWLEVFAKYQAFPQYQQVNSWMDLAAFKKIFFWEYLHRLFGRLIGLVVFLPWLYFKVTKALSRSTSQGALIAIALGGAQGVLGWYMVKSGLVDVPAVSHFRLAAHLLLALFVSQWVLWLILNLSSSFQRSENRIPGGRLLPTLLLGLLYVQIIFGAFVAGKRAGYMSSTFPDMNGQYLPGAFFHSASLWSEMVNSPLAIHYVHRVLGTLLLVSVGVAGVWFARKTGHPGERRLGAGAALMVLIQFTLGAITVVLSVPISWAVVHQLGAVLLLGVLTAWLHRATSATFDSSRPAS
jgi:heme a synthase